MLTIIHGKLLRLFETFSYEDFEVQMTITLFVFISVKRINVKLLGIRPNVTEYKESQAALQYTDTEVHDKRMSLIHVATTHTLQ